MSKDRDVAVIGLGYVGLPLALAFVEAGIRVVGVDTNPARVSELLEGRSPIDDIDDARLRAGLAGGLRGRRRPPEANLGSVGRDVRLRPDADHPGQGPGPGTGPARRRRRPRGPPRRPARRPPVDDVPGHDDRQVPPGARGIRARRRPRLRPRVRPRAGEPGRSRERPAHRPAPRRRDDAAGDRAGGRAPAQRQHHGDRALVARRGRARQAPRERLPQRQHRPRQPAGPAVRADGPRRLGGHRRGGDEAVRVHALPAGAGRRRPLHPRSTRTTSPGGPGSSTSWTASWSWPATSTSRCRATSSTSSREALNERGRALKGVRVGVIGVAFKPNVRDARNTPATDVIVGPHRARGQRDVPRPARAHVPPAGQVVDGLGPAHGPRGGQRGGGHRHPARLGGLAVRLRARRPRRRHDEHLARPHRPTAPGPAPRRRAGSPRPHASWRALSRGCGSIPSRPDTIVASRRLLAGFPDRGPTAA